MFGRSMPETPHDAELVNDEELVFDDPLGPAVVRREKRLDMIVREGEVLAGKYRVERIPGRAGLGVVVQVRHLELGQEVTLKFLIPDACAYPEFVQRFIREARAAVKIGGEHVARVTDVGRLDSGAPYMVREFLRGPDLAEVLKVRGPLPVAEAVDYIIQAAEGVAEGHALGIVHRNLRMTTLVVTRRSDGSPLVKVFDFAAAETLHVDPFTERSVSLVGTSAIMSSLPYLSPEQIRDPHDVDVRADVYSLGVILHELLTGRPVYSADNAPSLLASVAADAATSVRDLRPEVPGELDHVVLRCLAKNRAIRYPTVAQLVAALSPFGSRDSTASVERVQRLARQSTPPSRAPLEPAPPSPLQWSPLGLTSNGKSRGPTGTIVITPLAEEPTLAPPAVARPLPVDDVTVTQPLNSYQPLVQERARSPQTPQPPPIRASARPRSTPLAMPAPSQHEDVTVAAPVLAPSPSSEGYAGFAPVPNVHSTAYAAPHRPPPSQTRTTMMPPSRRSSLPGGMSRSWAASPDEGADADGRGKRQRMLGIGVAAAVATLSIVALLRSPTTAAPVAAAPKAPVVAPPPAPPPPEPPAPAAEVAPALSAAAAASAAVAAAPSVAPAAVAPAPSVAPAAAPSAPSVAPAAVAPAAVAPAARARVAVAPVPPKPRVPASLAAVAPKPQAPSEIAPSRSGGTKVASAPAPGKDLFDSPD